MSEDETKITSSEPVKIKDPKRVEAGKRLGAISKAAKEKKARERYDRERDLEREADRTIPIGIGVAVVGLIGLCYVCHARYKKKEEQPVNPEPLEREAAPLKRKVLDSFDE